MSGKLVPADASGVEIAERDGFLDAAQAVETAAQVDQGIDRGRLADVANLAKEDGMGLGLDLLHHRAVEGSDRIFEHRGTGGAGGPASEREPVVAIDALLAAEGQREQRVLLAEEVDDEMPLLADAGMGAGIAVDADENGWRIINTIVDAVPRIP